jgi:hypothetical protein
MQTMAPMPVVETAQFMSVIGPSMLGGRAGAISGVRCRGPGGGMGQEGSSPRHDAAEPLRRALTPGLAAIESIK